MSYGYLVFERRELLQLSSDLSEHMADIPPEKIVSVSHSIAADPEGGFRYSALVVFSGYS